MEFDTKALGITKEGNTNPPKLYGVKLKPINNWILVKPLENTTTGKSKLIEIGAKYKDQMLGEIVCASSKHEELFPVGAQVVYPKMAEFTLLIDDERFVLIKQEMAIGVYANG